MFLKQLVISNLSQIKALLLCNAMMGSVCEMANVSRLIFLGQTIISNMHQIKAMMRLHSIMKRFCSMVQYLPRAAHFLQMAADQQQCDAENAFVALLWDGRGVAKDLIQAVHCFRLAADHCVAEAQYRYGI
jgi:TPR repeat protein